MSSKFTILRPLNAGGHGDCYLGVRSGTREYVVVKYLREHHLADARRAFKREVRVLATKLLGLIPVLEASLESDRPYYVMPYLPGGPLTAYAGRLNEAQLRAIALAISSTLGNLHAQSVAHGDIKPDNILVGADGKLSVADPLGNGLGCTVLFSQNRGGTPGYWAPEIKVGGTISHAGDVYSFGATLYHLATGRPPRDDARVAIAASDQVPCFVRELVSSCCRSDPADRPSMFDIPRILNGDKWSEILASRQRWTLAFGALAVLGVVALLAD